MVMNMSAWLYQMSQTNYYPENCRLEIWEGTEQTWLGGHGVTPDYHPEPGDSVVFFYAPRDGDLFVPIDPEVAPEDEGTNPGAYASGIAPVQCAIRFRR